MSSSLLSAVLALSATALAAPLQQIPSGIPKYVIDYAPLVHLYTAEVYYPSDIGSQLKHTAPEINFTPDSSAPNPLTLDNLNALNTPNGSSVYLTSTDNIATNPSWLDGVVPDASGSTGDAISCAIITVDKGSGIVDAFYMYFYAYNWGGIIQPLHFETGDHVGDWEHNAIRFSNGVPQSVWYSQHSNGMAYTYSAVQKQGLRPISYSANGTHANYATPGIKDRGIPDINIGNNLNILNDYADAGTLWDPTLAAYYATYDATTGTFGAYDDSTPIAWLSFIGAWGDKQYPDSNPVQKDLLDLHLVYKYVSGPTGPEDKNLGRTNICLNNDYPCPVFDNLLDS